MPNRLEHPLAPAASTPLTAPDRLARLGSAALVALYAELALDSKPGLVSLRDNGSHTDMDARTFWRSIHALRTYFPAIAAAGAAQAPFETLQALGIKAEARMLAATGGINTHRGGIFLLGLLCAAAGRLHTLGRPSTPDSLRDSLCSAWGTALAHRAAQARQRPARSHGEVAARAHGLRAAGEEAALGLPTLFHTSVPALQAARAAGLDEPRALAHTLFATMAVLDDTTLVHRGGLAGLRHARQAAQGFLAAGGVQRADWRRHAHALHRDFVQRRLSPGGSADLLAAAHWVLAVRQQP